ncbi:MAG: DUF3237 domain-containing protein [Deltaproteobacteria bacterium]|nr:DUF3237 domain-containing protein [Deltaproteobacteria bacterium]MBW2362646.1 DUF3237 domain-containing protein [Deltaproteobacteria bacterium]
MKLVPLLKLTGRVAAPTAVGRSLSGTRTIYAVTGGEFEGERLRGRILPCGGEWFLQGDEGPGQVDVRMLLETDDGAPIYLRYTGVMKLTPDVMETLSQGKSTEYGDFLFLTQARFEAGDERYEWLNQTIAVGEGRVHPDRVEYMLYEVTHD